MSSGDASWTIQCNLEIFDSSRLLSNKNGQIPKNVVRRYVLLIRPRSDAVIAAGEGHVCFWTNLTQVNRFRRERDIHCQVKNLAFFK